MPASGPPPDRAVVAAFLRKQDWASIRVQLLHYTVPRCKSRERAEDFVQDAIIKVMTGDSSFDPAVHPSVARYLMGAIKFDLMDDRKSARARKTVAISRRRPDDDEEREGDHLVAPNAFSEDVAVRVDLFTRRITELRVRLAGDAQALRVLDLTIEGIETPAERAAATGWSFEAIEAARRRMQHHAAIVARTISGDDEDESDETSDETERARGGDEGESA